MIKLSDQTLEGKIIQWADEIRDWGIEWHEGGIYPGEMAAFLGACDCVGIQSIVESGRGFHAYSTQILGEYSERKGIQVVSIDYSPIEGREFENRLAQHKRLLCLAGDTFKIFPKAVKDLPKPIALLVDGPKDYRANRYSLVASNMFQIRIVAHHNCPLVSDWGKEFARFFPEAFHYEMLNFSSFPEWRAFKNWEKEWVNNYEVYDEEHGAAHRSLKASSLAIAVLPPNLKSRWRLLNFRGRPPLTCHPLWLWLKWTWSSGLGK